MAPARVDSLSRKRARLRRGRRRRDLRKYPRIWVRRSAGAEVLMRRRKRAVVATSQQPGARKWEARRRWALVSSTAIRTAASSTTPIDSRPSLATRSTQLSGPDAGRRRRRRIAPCTTELSVVNPIHGRRPLPPPSLGDGCSYRSRAPAGAGSHTQGASNSRRSRGPRHVVVLSWRAPSFVERACVVTNRSVARGTRLAASARRARGAHGAGPCSKARRMAGPWVASR